MNFASFFRSRSKPPAQEKTWDFTGATLPSANWFQTAMDLNYSIDLDTNTAVYSCVSILSQEIATIPIYHWRMHDDGSRQRVPKSNPERVLRRPNHYQTRSDFWLYVMRCLLLRGAAFCYAPRNNRTEVASLHPLPPRSCQAAVEPESGEVFYQIGNFGNKLVDVESTVPASAIYNPRINCYRHPLVGQSPITSFVNSAAVGSAIQRASGRFFLNMGRPSGILTTPKELSKQTANQIRDRWNAVTRGENIGGTPVLHNDLKWQQITMNATDAEVISTYNLSVSDIAMAYRVPLFMLGDLSKATFRNVESLMRLFYTAALRFYLEHLENGLNVLFELDGETEYLEFDFESSLLRGDLEQRIAALTKAVQGAVYTPNEARIREQLPPKEGGDQLLVQKQMVPLASVGEILAAEMAFGKAPADIADDEDQADEADSDAEENGIDELAYYARGLAETAR